MRTCFRARFIQAELTPEAREQCYFFNSFFYKKLTEKSGIGGKGDAEGLTPTQRAFQRVKKWTKACPYATQTAASTVHQQDLPLLCIGTRSRMCSCIPCSVLRLAITSLPYYRKCSIW